MANKTIPAIQTNEGNVGIGTTNPSYKIQVSGDAYITDTLKNGKVETRSFQVTFPNALANRAIDIRFPNTYINGLIEIEVTSGYNNQNSVGVVKKIFSVGANPNNVIWNTTVARVVEAHGSTPDNWTIGDFAWDATNSKYIIPVYHIVSTGNVLNINIRYFSEGALDYPNLPTTTVSALYTATIPAAYQTKHYVYYNDNVGIGTTNPSQKLDVNGAIIAGINNSYGAYTRTPGGVLKPWFATSGPNTLFYNTNLSGSIFWQNTADTASLMVLSEQGRLGINTNDASGRLHVLDTVLYPPSLTWNAAAATIIRSENGQIAFGSDSAAPYGIWQQVRTSSSTARPLLLNPLGGNVGVGVRNPTKKLHVAGNLYWDYNGTAAEEHAVGIQRTVAAANGAFTEIGSLAASPSSIRATFEIFHHDSSTIEYSLFELIANYYTGTTTDWVQLPSRTQAHYAGDRNGVVVDARLASTGGSIELRLRSIGGAGAAMMVNVRIKSNTNLTETSATGTGATVAGLLGFNRYEFPVTNNRFKATTEGLFILNNGNIGIGTTSPSYLLTAYAASAPQFTLSNATRNFILTNNAADGLLSFSYGAVNRLQFDTTNQWFNTGNVGIGTTSPAAKLDVAGTVRLSSNLLSHKTASYTTSYPGINSFGADTTDSAITYYDTGKLVANQYFRGVVWTGKHYIFTDHISNLAYFYDNNFNLITNSYGLNSVSLPLPSGYAVPHGAAWDGRYLWVVCYVSGETVASKIVGYDLDSPSGNAAIIAESAPLTNITAAYDIEYADGHFYIVRSGSVYIYRWNGSTIDLINTIVGEAGSITAQAITYDGSYLWVTQNGQPVYKLGLDGYQDAVITSGFPPNTCGWAWNGSNIVTFAYDTRIIYIINTTRLRIDTQNLALMGGRVGIGITNPGDRVQANLAAGESILANIISNAVSPSNKVGFKLSELGGASAEFSLVRDGTSYQAKLQTLNAQPLSFGTNSATRMVIDAAGNVGIGTISPTGKLTVQGNIEVNYNSTTADSFVRRTFLTQHAVINRGANIKFGLIDGGGLAGMGVYNVVSSDTAYNSQFIAFNTHEGNVSADERMRITQLGDVGIGTFTPLSLLTVGAAGSTTAAKGLSFGGDASANLYRSAAGALKIDGSLGIGISPVNKLVVSDSKDTSTWNSSASSTLSNIQIHNYQATINRPAVIELVQNDHSVVRLVGYKPDATSYWLSNFGISVRKADTNMHQVFTAQYDGNIGIGSTTPGAKLDVVGNINVDGSSFHRIANDSIITAPSDHGLVAYYGFDEGSALLISDKTGRNNTSALGLTYTTTAIRGTALDGFGGNNNYVIVPDSTDFDFGTGDFAVSLWCRPSSSFTGVNNTLIEIGLYTAGILIRPQANTNTLEVYLQGSFITQPTIVWAANVWYHIVVTRISSVLNVYSNGTRIASVANTSNIQVASAGYIGRSAHAVGQFFYGIIDEVKIYKGKGLDYGEVRGQYLSRGDSMLIAPIFSTTNGNVGIGTTSVGHPLEVYGTSMDPSLTPSAASILSVNSLGVELAIGRMVTSPYSVWLQGKHATVGGDLTYPIVLNPLGGYVGIGTTSPTQKLDIVGSYGAPDDDGGILKIRGAGVGPTQLNFGVSADGGYGWIQTTDVGASNERNIILNPLDGNVGIGTVTTLSLLTVGPVGSTTAANGITLGGDGQANLYRAGEDIIKTDATLQVVGNIDGFGSVQAIGSILHRSTIRVLNKAATDWVTWFTRDTSESETIGRLDNIRSINGSVAGNLGIGTTLPSGKLHVASTVAGATVLRTDGTNGTLFSVVDDLSDSLMSVNNSAGLPVLEVFADDRVVAGQYGSGDFVLINNKVGLGTSNPANKLTVIGAASIGSSAYNLAAPTNGLLVEGNVGIGTTSVGHPLEVYGTSMDPSLTPSAASILSVNSLGVELAIGRMVTSPYSVWLQGKHATVGGNVTYPIVLNPLGGNVGIGITNPSSLLHLAGVGGDGVPFLRIAGTASDAFNWGSSTIYANLTANETAINIIGKAQTQYNSSYIGYRHVADGSASNMLTLGLYAADFLVNILGNGNVGIGLTNPSSLLHVAASAVVATLNSTLASSSSISTLLYRNVDGNSNPYSIASIAGESAGNGGYGSLIFSTAFNNSLVERMRINTNGNVGIGTQTPSGRLHVNTASYSSLNKPLVVNNGVQNLNTKLYDTAVIQQDDVTTLRLVERNAAVANQILSFSIGDGFARIACTAEPMQFYVNGGDAVGDYGYLGLNGTKAIEISTTANVGIGNVTPSAARLHIKGDGFNPVLRVETALLVAGTTTASKTFVGWMPMQTGALSPGDTVFIPLFK